MNQPPSRCYAGDAAASATCAPLAATQVGSGRTNAAIAARSTFQTPCASSAQGVIEMTQQPCPDCLGSDTEIQDGSFFSCRDCGFSGELEAGHPYREAAEEQVYWCRLAGGFRIGRPKISITVARAEARMRLGDGLYWCRKCSGEPPQHIKDYEKYAEVICGDCFFSQP